MPDPDPARAPVWITQRAQITPTQPALIFRDTTLSFASLEARAKMRAHELRAFGLRDGDVLAVFLPNTLLFVELLHAASLAGAIFLPLNTRHLPEELLHPLRDALPRLLICEPGTLQERAQDAVERLDVAPLVLYLGPDDQLHAPGKSPVTASATPSQLHGHVADGDVFVLLYTSGTTGQPKGVPLSYGNFRAAIAASTAQLGADPHDCWLACLPLFHIGGLSILVRSVLTGMSVLLQERFDPQAVARAVDETGVTLLSLVPTMLDRLLNYRGDMPAPKSLRAVLLGGGPVPPTLVERARALAFPVLPTYGLTEACSQVATLPLAELERSDETGPKPLMGIELRILDEQGNEQPRGCEGEIALRGATIMRGYWNQPEATRRALRKGWLHTGDIGLIRADRSLVVLDRRTDLIVSGGENVYPAEVEAVLLSHPEVDEAAVAGEADEEFGQRVAAWVVRQPKTRVSEEDLQDFCRDYLAGYKVPQRVYFVESLPRNSAGKLMRNRLPSMS